MDTAAREKTPLPYGQLSLRERFSPKLIKPIRRVVAARLRAWGMPTLVEPSELIASELCSNVRHTDGRFELRLVLLGGGIRLEVRDYSTVVPTFPREFPPFDADSGRGLYLVAANATRVGVDILGDGKIIWTVLESASCLAAV